MEFLDIVEDLRKKKGVTRKQLLEDCGINKNAFYYWEKNNKMPSNISLRALASYFGVSVECLKGDTPVVIPETIANGEVKPYTPRPVRPVVGITSAGKGTFAEECILGYMPVDEKYNTDDFFWLKVSGDSMSPKIDDGDLVLIQRGAEITNNSIAVAMVDKSETFLKQVYLFGDSIVLHSINPQYEDMSFKASNRHTVEFIGKARKVERDL